MTQQDSQSRPVITAQAHGAPRQCPVCSQSLAAFRFNGVETDICQAGCGAWFDEGELEQVESSDSLANIDQAFVGEFAAADVKAALDAPDWACPVDGAAMDRYEWNLGSGIVLDRCGNCQGIWMDAGELEGYCQLIKRFYESPPKLSPEIAAKLAQAQQEFETQWRKSHESAANVAVPWDFWIFDDIRRRVIQTVLRHVS